MTDCIENIKTLRKLAELARPRRAPGDVRINRLEQVINGVIIKN